jgi:2-polyprenyl-6-hydroxyphenyl methylase/3-demethylubiquinone-9 3-methyltransferase
MELRHDYRFADAGPTWANPYLWPIVQRIADTARLRERRAFDLGCGSGATANMLSQRGFEVVGVDPSVRGIALARNAYPGIRFAVGSAYDDLAATYGTFPLVVSLEVVEHCFDPRRFARTLYSLVEPGGIAVVSTPYHGYWKNLALAVAGQWDSHLTALWDGGHIKFFSVRTLRALLQEAGFQDIEFVRVGRIPPLAKSMIAIARK